MLTHTQICIYTKKGDCMPCNTRRGVTEPPVDAHITDSYVGMHYAFSLYRDRSIRIQRRAPPTDERVMVCGNQSKVNRNRIAPTASIVYTLSPYRI